MLQHALEHLRLRFAEWVIGLSLVSWGLIVLSIPNLFQINPFFGPLANIASEEVWGYASLFIGLLRLTFLTINGTYRQSAHIRAIGSVLSLSMWSTIFFTYVLGGHLVPNMATIGAIMFLDAYSAWWAAADAKIADNTARSEKEELYRLRRMLEEKEI